MPSISKYLTYYPLAGSLLFSSCNLTGDQADNEKPPNIIIILADDMGYSDLGCFGSEIRTPNLDRLANNGLRLTQFYNAARCCPTRASLLTGLYSHQAGMGDMTEGRLLPDSTPLIAYTGYLPDNCVTIAEVLKENGYQTMISGKWHVGEEKENWPHHHGFDDVYTLIGGALNYFTLEPWLREDKKTLVLSGYDTVKAGKDFYFTNEVNDAALGFLERKKSDQPFFLYLAHTAPHWPLHALPEDIDLFKGNYLEGWDVIRKRRFEKMKEMNLIPEHTVLPPEFEWGNLTPDWDTLTLAEKEKYDLRMAVHAAMIYRMDKGIGKIINHLEENGELDNTLIMFFSDNGATKATIHLATGFHADRSGKTGTARSFDSQGPSWANASNSPLNLFKSFIAEGGIRSSFIAHWPDKIKEEVISNQPSHVIDIMPTILQITGTSYPEKIDNTDIQPYEGKSLLPLFEKPASHQDNRTFCFEHLGNKGVRKNDWKLLYTHDHFINPEQKWELYDLSEDPTETQDLADEFPDILDELKDIYYQWANRVGVYEPYDSLILAKPF